METGAPVLSEIFYIH